MIKQEFAEGEKVYKFYFDRESNKLKHRYLPIMMYNYMDGCQWNVVDDYTLIHKWQTRKYFFFKEDHQAIYNYSAALLHPDYHMAKAKFLYQYFAYYPDGMEDETEFYSLAKIHYNELVRDYPEIILKMKTSEVSFNFSQFWM